MLYTGTTIVILSNLSALSQATGVDVIGSPARLKDPTICP